MYRQALLPPQLSAAVSQHEGPSSWQKSLRGVGPTLLVAPAIVGDLVPVDVGALALAVHVRRGRLALILGRRLGHLGGGDTRPPIRFRRRDHRAGRRRGCRSAPPHRRDR